MKIKLLIGFISVFASALVLTNGSSHAVSGSCYFTSSDGPVNSTGTCSVPGLGAYGKNDVLSGRNSDGSDSAIPSSVNTKSEFITFILGRFSASQSDHNRVGAAFIMQEMRGSRAWPSSANAQDWKARMESDNVVVKREYDSSVGRTSWFDDGKDNTFYADHPNVGRWVINVYYKGVRKAQIEYLCGNMVAGVVALPPPWTVTPNTTISAPVVGPGTPVTWTHTIKANGPGDTDELINYKVDVNNAVLGADKTGQWGSGKAPGEQITPRKYVYTPTNADIGKRLCQHITATPWSSSGGSKSSAEKCVTVISDYDLKPEIKLSSGAGIVDPGSLTDVTATVTKLGGPSAATQWQLSKIIVAPGGSIPETVSDNTNNPNAHYGNTWTSVATGSNVSFIDPKTDVWGPTNQEIDDRPVGTRICWALSIKPPSNDFAGWRHSIPVCVKIGKKPKIQALGGDVRVRGSIATSTSIVGRGTPKVPTLFGSWVEFGAFSVGDNDGFASGAGLRTGSPNTNQSQWSKLTFANTLPNPVEPGDTSSEFGNYSNSLPLIPDIETYFSSKSSQALGGSADLSSLTGVYKSAGDVTVTGGAISQGKTVVIISEGTVRITGNISYQSAGINGIANIPQVVIIAKNIEIAANVTNIDSWLIADGAINTCSTIPTPTSGADSAVGVLSANVCNLPLVVNGPVASSRLYLYRTAGSGAGDAISDPAEKFNLRPDAYLWAYQQGFGLIQPTTAAISELPPRF